jgi:hypothetical protein
MKRLIASVLMAVVTVIPACRESPLRHVVGTGTVYQLGNMCGDTWLLHADSGREYELTALEAAFQQSGLRVRFALETRDDVVSICMVGQAADVVSMRRL